MSTQRPFDTRLQLIAGPRQIDVYGVHGVARIAAGGATVLQWRDKSRSPDTHIETVVALRIACAEAGLPLIVNDRADIALAAGCAGVHLGQDDMTLARARELLGKNAAIGVTVRARDELDRTPLALADYVSVGGVFATSSKTDAGAPIGLAGLGGLVASVRERFGGPVIAISGITRETVAAVRGAGVEGIAVIAAVWDAPDPEEALRSLRAAVDASSPQRGSE